MYRAQDSKCIEGIHSLSLIQSTPFPFLDRTLLSSSGWTPTCDLLALASYMLGLQVCTMMHGSRSLLQRRALLPGITFIFA
jgi:hypothetical protein